MRKTLKILKRRGVDISQMRALEVFAREGDWQTIVYAPRVKSMEAWEINPLFKAGLKKNLPEAKIKITDSVKEIRNKKYFGKYDFIVLDNPQGCYGPRAQYCEHFDVILPALKLFNGKGVLIFNVNKQPFNFDNFPNWQKRRAAFYKRKNTAKLSIVWLMNFYKKLFKKNGYSTKFCFNMSRGDYKHNDYLHYLVYYLVKTRKRKQ